MRGRALEERRAKLRQLALWDRQNRCSWCKKALEKGRWTSVLTPERVFCSENCLELAATYPEFIPK